MKKVLLINTNTVTAPYPIPPIGLCSVAHAVANEYEVRVFDGLQGDVAALVAATEDFRPDYVGLSIRNIDNVTMERPQYYLDAIRAQVVEPIRSCTGAPMILGGAGFTILAPEVMEALGADFGVAGEGEAAFPALLRALDAGADATSIPRVVSGRGRGAAAGAIALDPDALPFPRLDSWIDFTPYRSKGAYSLQMKRGCDRECVYCTYPAIEGGRYRVRSVMRIVDELQETRDRIGDVMFEFVDSTLNAPAGLLEDVCREIVRRGLQVRLRSMGINPMGVTGETLDLMKAAGFVQIDCTPDAASPRTLQGMRKGFTLDALRQTAALIRAHDMPTMWFFVFGGPGENEETIQETFDFIDACIAPVDLVHVAQGLRIYPNTRLHAIAVEQGVIPCDQPMLNPCFYASPLVPGDRMTHFMDECLSLRPNCLRASEITPPPELVRAAEKLRREQGLTEPMFRTLLRLRAALWA